MKPLVYIFLMFALNSMGQNFSNAGLEGTACMSSTPPSWFVVSFSDPVCQAFNAVLATPDITGLQGPAPSIGVSGNPYSGNSFISGLIANDAGNFYQEGIRQTVTGLTPGKPYTISFYQSVVKQDNQLDSSGRWSVFIDNQLIGHSHSSNSTLTFDDVALIWEERSISFVPTSSTHSFKFLPTDDDPDQTVPFESLRMGIDQITLAPDSTQIHHDTICHGDVATIWAEGAGDYHWTPMNDPTSVLSYDSTLHTSPDSTTHYWCITNLDSNIVTVTVIHPPSLELGQDHFVCPGETVVIHPDVHGAHSHLWSDGSQGFDLETNENGQVWMIAENTCGSIKDSLWIYWDSLATQDFGFDTMLCSFETIELNVFYPNASYEWNHGSLAPSTLIEHAGDYWVDVHNECGTFTHEFHITSDPNCELLIDLPNVFTPDGDGVNDYFVPINQEHVQSYHLMILNRWGEVLFESYEVGIGWDGLVRGERASESVYFYKVDYADYDGNNNSLQGSLTLMR
ncbi:MAG: gliding motility-associated C-terminal domain-containing protein [bacterium]|nr:gliding motility-associated C-terminal domain-containing protein [bacterium]